MKKEDRRFSAREVRALLWLLPVLAVVSWLVWEISRTKPDNLTEAAAGFTESKGDTTQNRGQSDANATLDPETGSVAYPMYVTDSVSGLAEADAPPSPRFFDPNTVDYHDLVRLGFTRGEALGIIKYRERGKVFEIPEDFAACYQVSEAMYRRLKPYIRIGEQFRLKKFERPGSSGTHILRQSDPPVFASGVADGMPTEDGRTGIAHDVQSGSNVEYMSQMRHDRENQPVLIDLNTADSAALISVIGIGPRTVMSIMEYRARLGGFADVRQLAEVRGVTEQNYERIIEQIFVDPAVIQKININFAPAKSLAAHPYVKAEALRKLLKQRQLKGGWRTVEELEQDDIFTAEELERLGHYLIFN